MSKANRKPTGEKKSAKKGETTPSKTKRAKKGAPAAAAQHEEPTVAPTPVVETPAPTTDAERLDGRHVLDCLRFALDAAPKAKESPALAFVLVDGDRLVATDDYVHHTAWLLANVAHVAAYGHPRVVENAVRKYRGTLGETFTRMCTARLVALGIAERTAETLVAAWQRPAAARKAVAA